MLRVPLWKDSRHRCAWPNSTSKARPPGRRALRRSLPSVAGTAPVGQVPALRIVDTDANQATDAMH